MNSLAWMAAIIATAWLSYFVFEVLDIDEIGVAILALTALSIVMAVRGAYDDISIMQGNDKKND